MNMTEKKPQRAEPKPTSEHLQNVESLKILINEIRELVNQVSLNQAVFVATALISAIDDWLFYLDQHLWLA